jgi:hypothetical protein
MCAIMSVTTSWVTGCEVTNAGCFASLSVAALQLNTLAMHMHYNLEHSTDDLLLCLTTCSGTRRCLAVWATPSLAAPCPTLPHQHPPL